jgi:predicted SAM-dependent methyltransferase
MFIQSGEASKEAVMAVNFSNYPKKINLGCGFDIREGFLNVDLNESHKPDLICDITNLQDFPSDYFEYALANDILEHIQRPKIQNTLKAWNRILISGGILELRVPNVIGIMSLLVREENQSIEMQEKLLQCLFGTQAYIGDFHYFGFTDVILRSMLESAGFVIEQISILDEWLFHVKAMKAFESHVDNEEILFLSDREFLTGVYKKYLGRLPDEGGLNYYLDVLNSGISRESVIEIFMNCDEHKARMSS